MSIWGFVEWEQATSFGLYFRISEKYLPLWIEDSKIRIFQVVRRRTSRVQRKT